MEPQTYINQQIESGKDIVFGEEHTSIAATLGMMEETVRQNPNHIQGVSVEFSPRIQPHIDEVASGKLSVEDFTRLSRIANEQEYMEIAGALREQGRLSDDQYDAIVKYSEDTIQAVLSGTNNESYPPERQAIDTNAYGALYSLVRTASESDIPVIANDLDREALPLNLLGQMTVADLIDRMDDTADGNQLSEKLDLSSSKSILVHRGSFHAWDLTLELDGSYSNAGKGMDDYLESQGRNVTVIGNYESVESLASEAQTLENNQIAVVDPSDATVIGNQLIEKPDLEIAQQGAISSPPRP